MKHQMDAGQVSTKGKKPDEELVPIVGEGKAIRNVPIETVNTEECECAMFELGSHCMTRQPDPNAIIFQLERLKECDASLSEVKAFVLRHFTFQVAGSPEKSQKLTVKNWSKILTQGVIQEHLEVTPKEFEAATAKGYELREECKQHISQRTPSAQKSIIHTLIFSELLRRLFSLEMPIGTAGKK